MWVSDGSSVLSTSGNSVTCQVPESSGGNVYNAIWKGQGDSGLENGASYWKLTLEGLERGSIFAGVTDLQKFQKGWSCKGLFYGGNLSDGGGLLVGNFGPRLQGGDVLGIFVNIENNNLKVYFDVNGSSLGVAFDVPRTTLGQVFPAVHFSGSGTVSIQESSDFPETTRQAEKNEGLQGHWEYISGSLSAGDENIKLQLRASDANSYRGSLTVINHISINLTPEGPNGPWKGHTGTMTLMGGPPELMQLESKFINIASGTYSLTPTGELCITNGDSNSLWTRYVPQKNAVTENPFLH